MAFEHTDKKAGETIRSADWNAMGNELLRLGIDKISRVGTESLEGPLRITGDLAVGTGGAGGSLSVKGPLTVGTANFGAPLRVYKKQEDGSDLSHGAVLLGTDDAASASLRLGYAGTYSWIQGQGQQALALNPRGGNVGIGTAAPTARLHVGGDALVTGTLDFGAATRQMLNLWRAEYGVGVQNSTTYLRTGGNFAFYRGGSHNDGLLNAGGGTLAMALLSSGNLGIGTAAPASTLSVNGSASVGPGYAATAAPAGGLIVEGNVGIGTSAPAARLHVAGGDLRLDSGREIFFADNGQIRSLDNAHRILFRRGEDKLELREYGDIVFSPGAIGGVETARAILTANGRLAMGTSSPQRVIHTEAGEIHTGGGASGYSFSNRQSAWVESPVPGERWVWYASEKSARLWTAGDKLTVSSEGVLGAAAFRFGISVIKADQGGSIELGGDNDVAGTGTPYIDFHYRGKKEDYNARIINDADRLLTVAGTNVVKLECWDLLMGHSTRRGSPGRALVDGSDGNAKVLILNYDSDWGGGVRHYGALKQASSRRLKEDIEVLGDAEAAEILAGLEPVRFRMIGDENRAEHLGFIAEDVPDVISGPEHTAVAHSHVVAVLTRVVKEQQRRLDALTQRLDGGS